MAPSTLCVLVFMVTFVTMATSSVVRMRVNNVNNRPVIGVLSQRSHDDQLKYGDEYLMGEYVKYLEMAGASVIIINGHQPEDYYIKLFNQINGVLFPGGRVGITNSSYARSSHIIYSLAVKANNQGDYFPLWGTCQGFEMLTKLASENFVLQNSDSENLLIPLVLLPAYKRSRMLGKAPSDLIHILTHENVTANFHHHCLSTKTYAKDPSIHNFYRALSVNTGRKGMEFVSTMEAYNYPFYGVQWHPEKNIFTRELDRIVSRTANGARVTQYFANFFVDEARKNFHKFDSEEERYRSVIENDKRVFIPRDYIENFFYNVTKH